MKTFILLLSFVSTLALAQTRVHVATFDSGFGGYFTAKEIERRGQKLQQSYPLDLTIHHFGDTANAPYGSRTPEDIAALSAKGIGKALDSGAEYVFIACNTASTQYAQIQKILSKTHPGKSDKVISIIESSVRELKHQVDQKLKTSPTVTIAILATPATIKAGAYIRAFAESYGLKAPENRITTFTQERWNKKKGPEIESVSALTTIVLPGNKKVFISQLGPANWVEMIELGAPLAEKKNLIRRDLQLLSSAKNWDIVGEFCTHFPAIDQLIHEEGKLLSLSSDKTSYIKQGPLMAEIFQELMRPRLVKTGSSKSIAPARAKILISGQNIQETKSLAREIFPGDIQPDVESVDF